MSNWQRIYYGIYEDEILCDISFNENKFQIKTECSYLINWCLKNKELFNVEMKYQNNQLLVSGNFDYKILLDNFLNYLNTYYWCEWNKHKGYWYCFKNDVDKHIDKSF